MLDDVDLLVCGAGPAGCVIAERAANVLGWKVLMVDKRPHLAGNCYDSRHANGVLIHNYGPHYFRTNEPGLLDYLSRFTDWIPGNYEVKSLVRGRLFPFPINLTTLEQFFNRRLDAESAERLLAACRLAVDKPRNSEEFVLSRVGRELYEAFYLNYTLKQWDIHPRYLEPTVCGRIPIRLNRDHRYVDHRFQVMPKRGFTAMFARMVKHPRIRILLDCAFQEVRHLVRPRRATVYTGPIDEYFGCRLGTLPYRSLNFDMVPYATEYRQPCVQINYPNDYSFTRTVEIKHVTAQKHPETVLSYETPAATGEPYYPVPVPRNSALYQRYKVLADEETRCRRVYFCGRLAQYRYFNTDEVLVEALRCFDRLRQAWFDGTAPEPPASATAAKEVLTRVLKTN
ncbi:MAG TPA: UDP-galactopyranose mutase [Gemmataceae bacterium]|jgi:UDP-galactopyranose mutase|nr:UDP-galactopyranose mutase [Gemmataceae bacterium]